MSKASGKKQGAAGWIDALNRQKLNAQSARAGIVTKGWLDTGNYALNWAISGRFLGGYPLGHTAELFGGPGTGKSFLVARAIAMAQAAGGVALLDDTENAYNLAHTAELGVNVDTLAYRSSRTVKEHLTTASGFIGAYTSLGLTVPGVLACDSLSLLSTEHELATRLEKRDMTKAAELKAFFRIIGAEIAQLPVLHLSTSHVIADVGNLFNKRTTGGGGGPKYQASVRIDLRGISRIKSGKEYTGVICIAFIDKNRIVAPWKQVQLAIPFDRPVSRASGLVNTLLNLNILGITPSGRSLTYKGQDLGLPPCKSKELFLKQDDVGEKLLDLIPELLEEADEALAVVPALTRRLLGEAVVSEGGAEAEDDDNAYPDEVEA